MSLPQVGLLAILATLSTVIVNTQTASTRPPQPIEALGRNILSQLVGFNTTSERGSTQAAQAVAARALAAGFPERDVTMVAPTGHPDKANVVIRLRGRSSIAPVLYITHLDVVDARREDWTSDPFQLVEREGWLYGRGTIDMKGQDAAVLTALIRMRQEGLVPARDIIAAFTPDEETRGEYGVAWLFKEHRPLVDAALVINPDGGEAGFKAGRKLYVAVQMSEKIFTTFRLETTDRGGHSSRPTNDNPIYRLAAGLARLNQLRFPVHLTETTRLYFGRRVDLADGPSQADMRGLLREPPDPVAVEHLSAVVETNIQLRTTCTTTMIDGGHAENALPQRARATVQCRLVPGESPHAIAETIRNTLADPGIEVTVITPAIIAPDSPPTPVILEMVDRVTRSMWPGVVVLPDMSAGATDSVYTRALGIPSYGIDGMFDDLDDGRMHGRDERIGVVAFAEELEFTYRFMRMIGDSR
jgi:acetylornithine deacetylase/succinyl-diaminopimelate desuccinylase-like protein